MIPFGAVSGQASHPAEKIGVVGDERSILGLDGGVSHPGPSDRTRPADGNCRHSPISAFVSRSPPKSPAGSPDPAEFASFVEPFVVDFQNSLPVADDTKLADLPEWDSLAAPGTIVMRDTGYGVTITGNDLKECATVGDILARVRAKKAG